MLFGAPTPNIGFAELDSFILGLPVQEVIEAQAQAGLVQAIGRGRDIRASKGGHPRKILLVHLGSGEPKDSHEWEKREIPTARDPLAFKEPILDFVVTDLLPGGGRTTKEMLRALAEAGLSPPSDRTFRSWLKDDERIVGVGSRRYHQWALRDDLGSQP